MKMSLRCRAACVKIQGPAMCFAFVRPKEQQKNESNTL